MKDAMKISFSVVVILLGHFRVFRYYKTPQSTTGGLCVPLFEVFSGKNFLKSATKSGIFIYLERSQAQ